MTQVLEDRGIGSHYGIEVFDGAPSSRTTVTDRLAGAHPFHGGSARYTAEEVYAAIPELHFQMAVEPAQTRDGLVIPGTQALVRVQPDGTRLPLTTVGMEYTPLQVDEMIALMQPLSQRWPLHCAGLNPTIGPFFVLDRGDTTVAGVDVIGRFLLFIIPFMHGRSALLQDTSTRWFCQNQVPSIYAGGRDAGYRVLIPHRPNIQEVAKMETALLGQLASADKEQAAVLAQLARRRVSEAEVQYIIAAAFRLPKPPSLKALPGGTGDAVADAFLTGKVAESREQAMRRYEAAMMQVVTRRAVAYTRYEETNAQIPKAAGTAWAAIQGPTAVATHELGRRENPGAAAVAALMGDRALWMRRAMEAALGLVQGTVVLDAPLYDDDTVLDGELVPA